MTTKPETAKAMKERHLDTLARAYEAAYRGGTQVWRLSYAADRYAELRAVVYAITPGRQKAKNIGSQLDKAVMAAARVIRRRK